MSAAYNNLVTAALVLSGIKKLPDQHGSRALFQIDNMEKLDETRDRYFYEERSRRIFDWVMQCQAVSDFHGGTSLPVDWGDTPFPAAAWKKLEEKAAAMTSGFVADDYSLDRIDTWLLESYALKGLCEALPGDVVFDCGTFTGNTSLYFSQKVGAEGHVYGFEASPATFARYAENMRELANVTPVHAAVYDECGTILLAGDGDSGANVRFPFGVRVPSLTLDAFAREKGIARVDFIKMDVEGAEKNALEGAREIIRAHLPKMALSAYHKEDDLILLPELIDDIAPGRYEFRLRHYSNFICETVMFCIPRPAPREEPRPKQAADGADETCPVCRSLLKAMFASLRNVVEGQAQTEPPRLLALLHKLEETTRQAADLLNTQETLKAENIVLRSLLEKEKRKNQR